MLSKDLLLLSSDLCYLFLLYFILIFIIFGYIFQDSLLNKVQNKNDFK